MHYRRFGRTNLSMPVLSCGGMRYQHRWDDAKPEEIPKHGQRNIEATIQRALDLGINHIETARGYGTSEMQLGWILPELPREKIIVQTKVTPFADPEKFRETFEISMRYLQLDHVDLLSLHGVNNEELLEWSLRPGGCLEIAREWQREGRCRFIGFSTHAATEVIVKALATGEFDYVNLHWYFVNELNWPAIEEAARQDAGVFIISPSDKGGKLYQPPEKLVDLCAPLSPMAFNDLFCWARPQVHTLSVGAARPGDFDEHVGALEHYEKAAEITGPIAARLRKTIAAKLGPHWWDALWQDWPSFESFPGQVNVPEIVRLWTFAKSLDLTEWARMRYNIMGNGGHWFPGTNAAQFDAEEVRKIMGTHPLAAQVPEILREAHEMLHGEPKKRLSES